MRRTALSSETPLAGRDRPLYGPKLIGKAAIAKSPVLKKSDFASAMSISASQKSCTFVSFEAPSISRMKAARGARLLRTMVIHVCAMTIVYLINVKHVLLLSVGLAQMLWMLRNH